MRSWSAVALAVLCLTTGGIAVWEAKSDSVTIDEPVYVTAGSTALVRNDLRLNPQHPPLSKILAAAPVLAEEPVLPAGPVWLHHHQRTYGKVYLEDLRRHGELREVTFLSRLVPVLELLVTGLLVFALARRLVGPSGGVFAAALWLLNPFVIGIGHLDGIDIPFTLMALTVALTLVRWLEVRTPARLVAGRPCLRRGPRDPRHRAAAPAGRGATVARRLTPAPPGARGTRPCRWSRLARLSPARPGVSPSTIRTCCPSDTSTGSTRSRTPIPPDGRVHVRPPLAQHALVDLAAQHGGQAAGHAARGVRPSHRSSFAGWSAGTPPRPRRGAAVGDRPRRLHDGDPRLPGAPLHAARVRPDVCRGGAAGARAAGAADPPGGRLGVLHGDVRAALDRLGRASIPPGLPGHDGLQPRPRAGRLRAAAVGSREARVDRLLLAEGGRLRRRRARCAPARQVPGPAPGSRLGGDLLHPHEPRRLGPLAPSLQAGRHHRRHRPALRRAPGLPERQCDSLWPGWKRSST